MKKKDAKCLFICKRVLLSFALSSLFLARSLARPLFAALCHSRTPSASEATTTASDNRGNDDQDDDDAAAAAPDEWLDGDDGKQAAYYDSAFVLGRLSNL